MADGRLGGLAECWNFAPHVSNWLWARVEPELRGQGIGTALMQWAEARARARLEQAAPDLLVACRTECNGDDQPTNALFRDLGFTAIRGSLTMERSLTGELPAVALPAGIIIRPMQPGEEAAVYRANAEAFRDHHGHVETPFEEGFARMQQHNAANPYFDSSLWFVAIDSGEIAGMALCVPQRNDFPAAWIDALAVRRPWRKQGVGLALLYHSFGELRARGHQRVGLSVDAQSLTGATRLYERAGMHTTKQSLLYEKIIRDGLDVSTQELL